MALSSNALKYPARDWRSLSAIFSDASSNDNNSIKSVSSCSSRISSDSSHHASEALLVKQWKQMWSNCELEKTLRKSNVSTGTMRSTLNPTLLTIHHSKTFNIQKKCVFSQSHLPPLLPLLAGCLDKRHEEVVDEHQNVRCGADSDPKLKSNSLNNYHPHPKTENPRKVRDKISPKTVRHRTSKVKMKHRHWTTT